MSDATPTQEEHALRRALWVNHGCPIGALYGDDGEMQCNAADCRHDFKREPLAALCFTLMARGRLHAGVRPNIPRHTAEQLAQQRQHCAEMQAFLRRKGAATSNLRDATTYAEIAAVIDAYLEALEQLQGGGR